MSGKRTKALRRELTQKLGRTPKRAEFERETHTSWIEKIKHTVFRLRPVTIGEFRAYKRTYKRKAG